MKSFLNQKRSMAVLAAWGLGLAMAIAADAPMTAEKSKPVWLTTAEVQSLEAAVPKPPETGSPQDQEDLAKVKAAQAALTDEKIKEVKTDATFSIALFVPVVGPDFTAANDPATFALFKKVDQQTGQITGELKDHWKRLRPFEAHSEVKPVVGAKGFSYPSGHSTHAYVYAAIFSELYPDKAAAFQTRASLIAQSRVDGGVHYPTDIEAGQALGNAIAKALLANPTFQAELAKAKTEAGKK